MGLNLRDEVKLIAAGRVTNGLNIIGKLALGADLCYSARGMMMALGCIQALRCNSNSCPVGVATQNPNLVRGLIVEDKDKRVRNYHEETIRSVTEILGAMGLRHAKQIKPWHLTRRVGPWETKHYGEIFDYLEPGELLSDPIPEAYRKAWVGSTAESFRYPGT